jgi:hypothetical protein
MGNNEQPNNSSEHDNYAEIAQRNSKARKGVDYTSSDGWNLFNANYSQTKKVEEAITIAKEYLVFLKDGDGGHSQNPQQFTEPMYKLLLEGFGVDASTGKHPYRYSAAFNALTATYNALQSPTIQFTGNNWDELTYRLIESPARYLLDAQAALFQAAAAELIAERGSEQRIRR